MTGMPNKQIGANERGRSATKGEKHAVLVNLTVSNAAIRSSGGQAVSQELEPPLR